MSRCFVRHLPQLFAAILLVIGIFVSSITTRETFAGSNSLKLSLYAQEQSGWCWAAAIQMIMSYYGVSASQCEIVDVIHDGCPNEGGTVTQAMSVLHNYVFYASRVGVLGASDVVNEINAGRPFYARWSLDNGFGHVVVVHGYDSNSAEEATWIHFADPWPPGSGVYSSLSYDQFVDSGQHTWTDTLRVMD